MSYPIFKKNRFLILIFFGLLTNNLFAQETIKEKNEYSLKKGLYFGVEMGAGWLQTAKNNLTESRKADYIFGLYAGYCPFRALRAGIKIDGYLIEAFSNSNPEKGISISNANLQVQVFPFKEFPLFTNLQFGRSKYTNHHLHERNAKGYSQKLGFGYEYDLSEHYSLSLMSNYSFGKFKDVSDVMVTYRYHHYDSWDITLCLTYH